MAWEWNAGHGFGRSLDLGLDVPRFPDGATDCIVDLLGGASRESGVRA